MICLARAPTSVTFSWIFKGSLGSMCDSCMMNGQIWPTNNHHTAGKKNKMKVRQHILIWKVRKCFSLNYSSWPQSNSIQTHKKRKKKKKKKTLFFLKLICHIWWTVLTVSLKVDYTLCPNWENLKRLSHRQPGCTFCFQVICELPQSEKKNTCDQWNRMSVVTLNSL